MSVPRLESQLDRLRGVNCFFRRLVLLNDGVNEIRRLPSGITLALS